MTTSRLRGYILTLHPSILHAFGQLWRIYGSWEQLHQDQECKSQGTTLSRLAYAAGHTASLYSELVSPTRWTYRQMCKRWYQRWCVHRQLGQRLLEMVTASQTSVGALRLTVLRGPESHPKYLSGKYDRLKASGEAYCDSIKTHGLGWVFSTDVPCSIRFHRTPKLYAGISWSQMKPLM
jgi:hypothetical protein